MATAARPPATGSYSLFPAIPAPLQRLFDRVPLVTYPANALPDDEDLDVEADRLPALHVFSSAVDAAAGRPSFNPTCLKWQAFLRFADVPVCLVPSSNHASPTGALPFLLPPRDRRGAAAARPVSAHELEAYAKRHTSTRTPPQKPPQTHRAAAYQALLDTRIRRAWLHAVYLHGSASGPIAVRLYAHAASQAPVVRAALARQLRAAAAAEVWGSPTAAGTAAETAQIYRDADAALEALATVLGENTNAPDTEAPETPFFFGSPVPTLFDAAVFAYTHLLLEDDDDYDDNDDAGHRRFAWHDRTLPDAVRRRPALVRHRNHILARWWPEYAAAQLPAPAPTSPTQGVADSVVWVKV